MMQKNKPIFGSPRARARKRRRWCDRCGAYTNHANQIGCLVCTGVEPPAPDLPVYVTVLGMRYGHKVAIEATYAEDGGPVRTDRFDVPAGQTLATIHSFRPCTVHVHGHSYQLCASDPELKAKLWPHRKESERGGWIVVR